MIKYINFQKNIQLYRLSHMNLNFLPHPPNSAWLPPIDPNDQETLEQEEAMIQQEFKNILSQDLTGALGTLEGREEEEEQQEQEQGDDIDEYTDQIQIPVLVQQHSKDNNKYDELQMTLYQSAFDKYIQHLLYAIIFNYKQQNIVKNYMNNHFQDYIQQQSLDYLLNCSEINHDHRVSHSNDFSMSRDKLNLSQKEKTREQSHQDIMRQINLEKLEKIQLEKDLAALKTDYCEKYLHQFYQEFQELNEENIRLRGELNKNKKKITQDKLQRYSNRSSIKGKTSVNQVFRHQNQKTNTKSQRNRGNVSNYVSKNNSPNVILKKKQYKLVQSTANLGRSQIQSPTYHKKRDSLMTERKMEQKDNSLGISVNVSILDDRYQEQMIRESVSRHYFKQREEQSPRKNIFVKLLQNILCEERVNQNRKYQELEKELVMKHDNHGGQPAFINSLEHQIGETNEKLQILGMILRKYQGEMQEMNMNLKNVEEWSQKLLEVKGRYIQMQQKCKKLSQLRQQVEQKEQKIKNKKHQYLFQESAPKSILSIETMLKVLSSSKNPKQFKKNAKLYSVYHKQIKQLFKFDKEDQNKRFHRIVKVKETIDSIKEGRIKFNELIQIYQNRITKLQDKINRIKKNQENR